jgi:hypothetical protein
VPGFAGATVAAGVAAATAVAAAVTTVGVAAPGVAADWTAAAVVGVAVAVAVPAGVVGGALGIHTLWPMYSQSCRLSSPGLACHNVLMGTPVVLATVFQVSPGFT